MCHILYKINYVAQYSLCLAVVVFPDKLFNFGHRYKLYNQCFVFMAEIVSTFYLIDSNEDGRLSKKELNDAAFLIGLNPTTKELDAWWKEADINGQSDIKT